MLDEGAFVRIRHQGAGVISIKRYHRIFVVISFDADNADNFQYRQLCRSSPLTKVG